MFLSHPGGSALQWGAGRSLSCLQHIIIIFFKPSKNEGRKKIEKLRKNGEGNVPSGRPTQLLLLLLKLYKTGVKNNYFRPIVRRVVGFRC